ncbi:MAG: pyruvate dehydrogenase (acetyl-transferring) E1 component subunit alpha [Thermodesulfobacteriota bacterium]
MIDKELIQVIDPSGDVVDEPALEKISQEDMIRMYRFMVLTKLWNNKALSLQRQGRLGTLASVRGQEAANVGMGMALGPNDWFCPAFREYGAMLIRGATLKDLFLHWSGDERGARPPEGSRMLPVCITVGSHLTHAAGIAWGAKIRGERIAVMSSSGDGSTSQGDFYEALNFAGVFKLPVVFVIQNNHWAISIPVEKQTASETLAEKACAVGIDGVRADGNDVIAVYLTVKRLLDQARSDFKPALVELVTYRLGDHTTADDASRYRKEEEVQSWLKKDPIDRMRNFLTKRQGWTEEKEAQLTAECNEEVEQAVKDFEATPNRQPTAIFDHMYAEMPWHLKEQKEEMLRLLGSQVR